MVGAVLLVPMLVTTGAAAAHPGARTDTGAATAAPAALGHGAPDPHLPDALGGARPELRPQVPSGSRRRCRRPTGGVGGGLPLPVQRVSLRPVGLHLIGAGGDTHLLDPVAPSGQRAAGGRGWWRRPVHAGGGGRRGRPDHVGLHHRPDLGGRPVRCLSLGGLPGPGAADRPGHQADRRRGHHPPGVHRRRRRPPSGCGWPWSSPSRPRCRLPAAPPRHSSWPIRPPLWIRRPRRRRRPSPGWSAPSAPTPPSRSPSRSARRPCGLDALAKPGHPSLTAGLSAMAADPTVQMVSTPFAPVDASSLVDAGLGTELALQISRGAQSLAASVTHPVPTPGAAGLGAWIANDPLDPATATQLATDGYSQLVLPAASVSSSPVDGSTAEPFALPTLHGPVDAVVSDADLSARFTSAPGNPVLAAHQLVAELAQIYYEKPNDDRPPGGGGGGARPTGPTSPAFVQALLEALDGNPIIEAVTTSQLFGTFATSGRLPRLPAATGHRQPGAAGVRHPRPTPADRRPDVGHAGALRPGPHHPAQRSGAGRRVRGPPPVPAVRRAGQYRRGGGRPAGPAAGGRGPYGHPHLPTGHPAGDHRLHRLLPGAGHPDPDQRQAALPNGTTQWTQPATLQLATHRGLCTGPGPGLGRVQGGRRAPLPRRRPPALQRRGRRAVDHHLGGRRHPVGRGAVRAGVLVVPHLAEAPGGSVGRRRSTADPQPGPR